jgi:NAD(P)-dependent dehydrogenase (short-subunit alcohol dehydrogenase family)
VRYLEGKAIVVTGAGRGLGRSYAQHIAAAGGRVVVNDVDAAEANAVEREIRNADGAAIAVPGSVADWGQAQAVVDSCVSNFGGIDGLVNNAGTFHAAAPWEETEEQVRRIVDVNVLGSIFCGIHALRAMREAGRGGAIVNVTSGAHLGLPGISTYGMTKGAAVSMTYGWALHAGQSGVRVNAVSPTALTRMSSPKTWRHNVDAPSTPEPDVVAPLVTFLLGDRARSINGQVVRLDGRKLALLTRAQFRDEGVEGTSWSVDSIADAVESGALGPLSPVGMVHPATRSMTV